MPIKGRDGRYEPLIKEMRRRVQLAVNSRKKIIWLDETVFTKHTNLQREWSKTGNNLYTPCEAMGAKYTAACAAISEGCGIEYLQLYDHALDKPNFKEYLRALVEKNKRKRLVVYMDNLKVHRNPEMEQHMRDLKIEWIWNVPYMPEFQPIETVFS